MARSLATMLLLLALFGCHGSGIPIFSETPTSPWFSVASPVVTGTYRSNEFFRMTITQVSTGKRIVVACEGSLSITSQDGAAFSGSFIRRTCTSGGGVLSTDTVSGTVSNGAILTDSAVSFDLRAPGVGDIGNLLKEEYGCVEASSSTAYEGRFSSATVSLTASGSRSVSCVGFGTLLVEFQVSGTSLNP